MLANRCLRHVLNIKWTEKISNEDLWERSNPKPASQDIKKCRCGWIGYTLRKPADNLTKQAVDRNSGKAQGSETQTDLEEVDPRRGGGRRENIDPTEEGSSELDPLEWCACSTGGKQD